MPTNEQIMTDWVAEKSKRHLISDDLQTALLRKAREHDTKERSLDEVTKLKRLFKSKE